MDIYNDLDAELVNLYSCIKECSNVLLRELKFPAHPQSQAFSRYYRDFVAHKEVYYQNVQAEIAWSGRPLLFYRRNRPGSCSPFFRSGWHLFDVKRAAAYYLAIRGSFSATVTSFGVRAWILKSLLRTVSAGVRTAGRTVPLEEQKAPCSSFGSGTGRTVSSMPIHPMSKRSGSIGS